MESYAELCRLFSHVSWLWYAIAVIVVYAVGALWYTVLFGKYWLKALNYICLCGANLSIDEKCTCKPRFPYEMVFQFISTAILGLLYFLVAPFSIWVSVAIVVAFSAWTKSMMKFQIADWRRFKTLAAIDVGYFVIASIVFILFSGL